MPQVFTGDLLSPMIEAVSLKSRQLELAIRSGDDALVRLIDGEIDPLIGAVVDFHARTPEEIRLQLRFVSNMTREYADDRSCVVRHSAMMAMLVDRYFGGTSTDDPDVFPYVGSMDDGMAGDDSLLNETVLNTLPVRVAVLTRDYRYLLGNEAEACFYGLRPFEMIGRHIRDVVGEAMFDKVVRPLLDRCFEGERVATDYPHDLAGAQRVIGCRLMPLTSRNGSIVGAIAVNQQLFEKSYAEPV